MLNERQFKKKSGIGVLGDVPWGTHICQFYFTKEELTDIIAPYLKNETVRLSERVKKGEKITNYETIRQRKDGKQIHVSVTLSPVFDIDRKLTSVSFISRGISERKK